MNVLDKWLAANLDDLVSIRRDLHAHPEIAFDEHRTTRVIAERLHGLGLAPVVPTGGTGVLCGITFVLTSESGGNFRTAWARAEAGSRDSARPMSNDRMAFSASRERAGSPARTIREKR